MCVCRGKLTHVFTVGADTEASSFGPEWGEYFGGLCALSTWKNPDLAWVAGPGRSRGELLWAQVLRPLDWCRASFSGVCGREFCGHRSLEFCQILAVGKSQCIWICIEGFENSHRQEICLMIILKTCLPRAPVSLSTITQISGGRSQGRSPHKC